DQDGRWRIKWNPADFGLRADQNINYRVRLDDGKSPLAPFELGGYRYQPWWSRVWQNQTERQSILGVSGVLGVLILYLAALAIILWLAPARLAGNVELLDIKEKTKGTIGILIKLFQRAIETILLPWFVCHPRVRRAWTGLYLGGKAKLEQLSK